MKLFMRIIRVILLLAYYFRLLLISSFRVAIETVTLPLKMRPAIVGMELELQSEAGILLLSNMITMTPGTLSLDLTKDRKKLYMHVMYAGDLKETIRQIRTLEARIKKILEK